MHTYTDDSILNEDNCKRHDDNEAATDVAVIKILKCCEFNRKNKNKKIISHELGFVKGCDRSK